MGELLLSCGCYWVEFCWTVDVVGLSRWILDVVGLDRVELLLGCATVGLWMLLGWVEFSCWFELLLGCGCWAVDVVGLGCGCC